MRAPGVVGEMDADGSVVDRSHAGSTTDHQPIAPALPMGRGVVFGIEVQPSAASGMLRWNRKKFSGS